MKKKSKRTKGMEEARPFEGMSKVNRNAAGVDIGATEIVACVSGGEEVQLVKAFGNYTVDLQSIANGSMSTRSRRWRWKVPGCIGSRCLKNWSGRDLNVC